MSIKQHTLPFVFASYKIVRMIVWGGSSWHRTKLCLMFLRVFRADELRDFLLSDECYSVQLSLLLSLRRLKLK